VTPRAKGDGGLSWDAARERWVASAAIGYDGRGKRLVRRGRGRTKTEEKKNKLRQLLRDHENGLVVLIRSGRLRTVKAGRRRLVPVAALTEYVASLDAA
jgi:hypothetical protein